MKLVAGFNGGSQGSGCGVTNDLGGRRWWQNFHTFQPPPWVDGAERLAAGDVGGQSRLEKYPRPQPPAHTDTDKRVCERYEYASNKIRIHPHPLPDTVAHSE